MKTSEIRCDDCGKVLGTREQPDGVPSPAELGQTDGYVCGHPGDAHLSCARKRADAARGGAVLPVEG